MPRMSPKTVNAVRVLLKKKKVFDFPTLLSFLNCSIRSGRLKLTQWQAHTSYNKSGQYYALPDVPRFDENGLWWFKGAYFSKYGTLKNTVVHLVGTSHRPDLPGIRSVSWWGSILARFFIIFETPPGFTGRSTRGCTSTSPMKQLVTRHRPVLAWRLSQRARASATRMLSLSWWRSSVITVSSRKRSRCSPR
jgi:hypothetical protein